MLFFFNPTSTTDIYTLSLHDALPIYKARRALLAGVLLFVAAQAGLNVAVQREWLPLRDPVYFEKFSPADRKSTRLNSSHRCISYAVFCLKKKKNKLLCLNNIVQDFVF